MNAHTENIASHEDDPVLRNAKEKIQKYIEESKKRIIDYKKENTNAYYPEIKDLTSEDLKNLIPISDILDNNNYQYIDLVMEGGGMHGIALLGYIGLLEALNIRFFNVAGTSAGAITATLLMGTGKAEENKFDSLLNILITKSFYDFVDGKAAAKELIDIGLQPHASKLQMLWSAYKAWPNLRENLGLNPGIAFERWMEGLLKENNRLDNFRSFLQKNQPNLKLREVSDRKDYENRVYKNIKYFSENSTLKELTVFKKEVDELINKERDELSKKEFNDLKTIPILDHPTKKQYNLLSQEILESYFKQKQLYELKQRRRLALIAADITTGSKVELPAMVDLYLNSDDPDRNLAKFVRASMSVPYFFHPVVFHKLPQNMPILIQWCEETNLKLDLNKIKEAQILLLQDQKKSYPPIDDKDFNQNYSILYNSLKTELNKNQTNSNDHLAMVELIRLLPDVCLQISKEEKQRRLDNLFNISELIIIQTTHKSLEKVKALLKDTQVKTLICRLYSKSPKNNQTDRSEKEDPEKSYESLVKHLENKIIPLSQQLNEMDVSRFNFPAYSKKYEKQSQDETQQLKDKSRQGKNEIENKFNELIQKINTLLSKLPSPEFELKKGLSEINAKLKKIHKMNDYNRTLDQLKAITKDMKFYEDSYRDLSPLSAQLDTISSMLDKADAEKHHKLQLIQDYMAKLDIFKLAQKELDKLPTSVTFVDGGVISNFPISVFHNHDTATPLSPTFGVKLGLDAHHHNTQNVTQLFSAMFNSTRNTSDFDFIKRNPDYTHLLTYIDIPEDEFNWLDFNMSLRQKVELILLGVDAAEKFILGFDWERYKAIRTSLSKVQAESDLLTEERVEIEKKVDQMQEDNTEERKKTEQSSPEAINDMSTLVSPSEVTQSKNLS